MDTGAAPNLARLNELALERLGDHRSLFFEGEWFTSGALFRRAERVAAGLIAAGVRPGDRVLVMMSNCPEVAVTYNAVWRAGGVVTPVIFLVSPPELRHILADSGAVAVVTTTEVLPKVQAAAEGLPLPIVVVGQSVPDGDDRLRPYAELEAAEPVPVVERRPDDLAVLLYTGGTTGRSKGVPLSHANWVSAGASSKAVSEVPGLVRHLTCLPLSHSFGLLVTINGMHSTQPSETTLMRWFEAPKWLELAAAHHVQGATGVPSMLAMLLAHHPSKYDLGDLTYFWSGAAPLPPAVVEGFESQVPSVTILDGYGCTESSAVVSSTPPGARKLGTVGRPAPGLEVRIVDLEGAALPAGQDGEITVRGPNVMAGYWQGDAADDAVQDGWLHTGDIGHLDDEGYLSIVDRKKDLIIRGGYNVYPRDVEDMLIAHPAVSGAAVVGRPDERVGEEVVAFVALNAGETVTADELIAYAKTQTAATKYPREIHLVEAIPLTSVGKVDRKRVRSLVRTEPTP